MKKLALLLAAAITLTACSGGVQEPLKSPEEMVKEAITKASDFRSGTFLAEIEGSMQNPVAEQDIDFQMAMNGAYDVRDLEMPKFDFTIDGTGNKEGGDEQKVKLAMRFIKDNMYVSLNEITDFEGQVPLAMVQGFMNQWWSIPMTQDEFQTATLNAFYENPDDPKTKALKELYQKHLMFKDLTYVGSEKVNKANAYVYSWNLDKEALIAYLKAVGEITEQSLTAEELANIEEFLQFIEASGKIYIDQEQVIVVKMDGAMKINDLEGVSADFDLSYKLANWNEDVTIEVPEGATEFDPFALLGGSAVGSGADLPIDALPPDAYLDPSLDPATSL